MSAPDSAWWTTFYDDEYAEFGLIARTEQANAANEAIVEFVVRELGLVSGDRVFDQCCGIGRIAIPLAQRGMLVTGVDVAEKYVAAARARAAAAGVSLDLHVGDAFELAAPVPCKAAFNWFTSFGYSPDDRQNQRMLERAHASLIPGGQYAIDFINVPRALLFRQRTTMSRHRKPDGTELLILEEPEFDFTAGMLRSTWTVIYPDGRRTLRHSETRMYMPHEIVRLLEAAGFASVRLVGSVAGEPFEQWGARCIAIATK